MDWIASIIVGILSLVGVIVTNSNANQKMSAALEKAQAVTDTKLEALTHEVRQHNGFAQKIPVIEEQIKVINHRLSDIEGDIKK